MAIDYAKLKVDDAAGHPDTGAFDIDPALAAKEWNAFNRPGEAGILGMVEYLSKNRSRTNDGADTTPTALLGRLTHVGSLDVGANVFGRAGSNDTVTTEMKHAAQMFVGLLMSPSVGDVNFTDTEIDAAYTSLGPPGGGGCGVWKTPDIDALKALSAGAQSYATEKGYPRLRTSDIITARAS